VSRLLLLVLLYIQSAFTVALCDLQHYAVAANCSRVLAVTAGCTDTMAYTASALSLMLQGFRKPIVLTGDACQNLIDALTRSKLLTQNC
jgi:hypothetical protein